LKPGRDALRQAMGVRGLLQAGADILTNEPDKPFVCLRESGNSTLAKAALPNLNDVYLHGVGLCLAGEYESGLAALKEAGKHSNAQVQYAAGLSAIDAQAGVDILSRVGLTGDDLEAVIQKLSIQPGIDPYPGLRVLAQQANTQPETWIAWLQGSSRLEAIHEWQAALDWISEGLAIAPSAVRGSLNQRAGRIYQTLANPPDYHAALASYNQAIEKGGWIYPEEEAYTHIYRGEVYLSLYDEFGPDLALEEFKSALDIQPNNYWAVIEIGDVYLYDLREMDQAETYYLRALEVDKQSPYAYFYIGEVYKVRGDKETAADWYRKALEHQPNWQPALDQLKALEGK
jgi:tetratricopeptide (TPR) repeat protein